MMARAHGAYSRIIAGLKILLPLVALALLSTLFLLSRSREPLQDVPVVEALQGQTATERVTAPFYSGTTARGDALSLTAATVRPLSEDVLVADALSARLRLSDGSEIRLSADTAELSDITKRALLKGNVQVDSSTGYVVTTDQLWSSVDQTEAESLGPVTGRGPAGRLEAGKMRVEASDFDGSVQILFTDGVKLIYQPQSAEE